MDADGIVTITGTTRAAAYPLRSPEIEWGTCDGGEVSLPGVISRLGGDGALLYSSYLCGGPAAAFTPDGSIHVQGRAQVPGGAASVLRLEVPEAPVVSLDQVSNAFSGARGIGPGTLVLLSGTGLGPDSAVNVGWAPQEALPLELGGTQVLFDGQSARIMFTSQGRVFCVTPAGMKYPRATVQIVHAGKKSNIVGVPVLGTPGLLTVGFPDAGLYTAAPGSEGAVPQGIVLNGDGTLNGPGNPAAPSSAVTAFATGPGVSAPPLEPGTVAPADVAYPLGVFARWSQINGFATVERVSTVPGLIVGIYQARVRVPQDVQPPGGSQRWALHLLTTQGDPFNGLRYVPASAYSNVVAVYVGSGGWRPAAACPVR